MVAVTSRKVGQVVGTKGGHHVPGIFTNNERCANGAQVIRVKINCG
jgi:hypothetical protein